MRLLAALILASATAAFAGGAAKPVAVATDPSGQRVELYAEQGQCPESWKRVGLFHPNKKPTEYGCWATDGAVVYIAWDDGMKDMVPTYYFEAPGAKPSKGYLQDQSNPLNT
jgi:hypothetical protein